MSSASAADVPELFPDGPTFALCSLIMIGAQLLYAAVGFGAGMFSITLLAMLLPDLAGAVATLFLLTLVTELWVLSKAWRKGNVRLLFGLLPSTVIGMWIGSQLLVTGPVLLRYCNAALVGRQHVLP